MASKIFLASASRARKELLSLIGVKAKVIKSRVREAHKNHSAEILVKSNALKKARAVALKIKEGAVIAADTLVVANGRLFGKPRTAKQAFNMLKCLSRVPHIVYTGFAVLKKTRSGLSIQSGVEKTKVWLKMSDQEIKGYLRSGEWRRAGGFDIGGRGSVFVKRIEGSFTSVVGLPLNRIYMACKKLNIKLLSLCLMALILAGCNEYNVVTNRQDIIFFDTQREVNIGRSVARQIEAHYKVISDPVEIERINKLAARIIKVCDRPELSYQFSIVDEKAINAISLPGGFIYINKGLMDFVKTDDELAGVIAHEIAHVVAKHSIKRLQASVGLNILTILAAAGANDRDALLGTKMGIASLVSSYSREDEMLADKLAARYMKQAGFDGNGLIDFLERLKEKRQSLPLRPQGLYARSHPYISERVGIIKEELGQELTFEDYINRTQSVPY